MFGVRRRSGGGVDVFACLDETGSPAHTTKTRGPRDNNEMEQPDRNANPPRLGTEDISGGDAP